MKSAVIVFPGSNCDRDMQVALRDITGQAPEMVWHGDSELPKVDLVALPGGFSYGDYLRCGAMAGNSPIINEVIHHAESGGYVLGVCNGFQILTETHLLPGVLMRNKDLKFICKHVALKVTNTNTAFTLKYSRQTVSIPIAHGEGNYVANDATLAALKAHDQIVFTYTEDVNGATDRIAGITNKQGNVLGMMPHPERIVDAAHGGTDGRPLFESLMEALS